MPTGTTVAPPTESPTGSPAETRQRCRTIRPSGHQCPSAALRGHEHCFFHGRDRRRLRNVRYSPAVIEIPILDNYAAVQVVCTDVARALAAGTLDIHIARQIGITVGIALRTLPRPTVPEAGSKKEESAAAPEPVAEIILTPEGEEIAPVTPYDEASGKPKRVWSFAEFLYRTAFPEHDGEPLPESGYEDPEKGSPLASLPEPHPETGQLGPLPGSFPVRPLPPAQPDPPPPAPDANPPASHQPKPGILPELQAEASTRMSRHPGQRNREPAALCQTSPSAGMSSVLTHEKPWKQIRMNYLQEEPNEMNQLQKGGD
jgi:hypothetical protein